MCISTMSFNASSAPGTNCGLGVQLNGGESPLDGWRTPRRSQGSVESRIEVLARRVGPGQVHASYMPLNADPRLLPERSGAYLKGGTSSAAAAATPQLGAAISRGYGRAPTAFVYTSADTLLSTTTYQSPAAAGAVACVDRVAQGAGSVQAFAFSCDSGFATARGGSISAPASPLGSRTLLYTRASAGTGVGQQQQQQQGLSAAPAVDLLDRLTLLRRLAPTTDPAPRPARLAAISQSFTPAPAPTSCWKDFAAPGGAAGAGAAGAGSGRRWAWDDSLLGTGCGSADSGCGSGRPLAAVPAPGWRYCGDVLAAAPAAVEALGGASAIAAVAATSGSAGGRAGMSLEVAIAADGGRASALAERRQLLQQGDEDVVLLVRSPRPHHLHIEEDAVAEDAAGDGAEATAGRSDSRAAFRPPGPLKHKFGNKPVLRPYPAPSLEDHARAAGLRGCGCPRSPRQRGDEPSSAGWQDRRSASSAGRQRVSWAGEEDVEAVAVLTHRPRSAEVEELRRGSRAAAAAAPPPRPSSACLAMLATAQQGGTCIRPRSSGGATACTATVGSPAGTTSVSVTSQGDVVVVSSPRAASAGLGSKGRGQEEVMVVATSPRAGSTGGTDVVVVCHEQTAGSPCPAGKHQPAQAAAPAASSQRSGAHTKLTVSVPAGSGSSFRIRADASGAAAAAPAPRAPAGSGPTSPIKAWRPQAAPAFQGHAAASASAAAGRAVASALVGATPVQPAAGLPVTSPAHQARAAELERLEGEMRRREQSFSNLLGELDRISAKCAKLTAGTAAAGSSAGGAGSVGGHGSGSAGGAGASGRAQGQPRRRSEELQDGRSSVGGGCRPHQQQQQQHTTHCFGSLEAALEGSTLPAAAVAVEAAVSVSSGSPAGGRRGDDAEWGWENLMAFEQQIRDQQHKLVEQGVLPPEFA
ncbi:hypothetical protein ABPG75_005402 [Micractinium tetrahymenae]